MSRKIKVCYVLSYRAPNYVRTTSIIESLKLSKRVELFVAKNNIRGLIRYLETFVKFLWIRVKYNPDAYIVGFRGHEIYWLLRIFALRKAFFFDEMMSPYFAFVEDRLVFKKSNLLAKLIFWIEKSILENANYILTDTDIHVNFLTDKFQISKKKIVALPVGTDEGLFSKQKYKDQSNENEFTVFFYSTFLPLHGISTILKAALRLRKLSIKFVIIGGQDRPNALEEFEEFVENEKLKNIEHYAWIEFESLPEYISKANLCLGGPFGDTPQARRVITGKTYQFLCLGKPTVIGKIEGLEKYGFTDRQNCLICEQGNPKALAETIRWAYENRNEISKIGSQGKNLFEKEFSYNNIKSVLEKILGNI